MKLLDAVVKLKYLLSPKPGKFSGGSWRGLEHLHIERSAEDSGKWIVRWSLHSGLGSYLLKCKPTFLKRKASYLWWEPKGGPPGFKPEKPPGDEKLTLEEALQEAKKLADSRDKLLLPLGTSDEISLPSHWNQLTPTEKSLLPAFEYLEFKQRKFDLEISESQTIYPDLILKRTDHQKPILALADNPFNYQKDTSDNQAFVNSWRCEDNSWELRWKASWPKYEGEMVLIKIKDGEDYSWVGTEYVFRSGLPSYTIAPKDKQSLFVLSDILSYLESIGATI